MSRILAVDDETMVGELITTLLASSGHRVVTATSVPDAEGHLSRDTFDVLLCDVNLGGESGVSLLEHLEVQRNETAVVVMSGGAAVPLAMDVIHRGAYDFLTKPFTDEELNRSIDEAVRRREKRLREEARRVKLETLVRARTRDLSKALDQVEHAYDQTIEALGAALDLRDTETQQHCRSVAALSLGIARAFGMTDPTQLRDLRWGALLHDIGKIGIPDNVLRKPGPLTSEEREVVNAHPEMGFRLIRDIDFLQGAADVVFYHHERFDGSGYPEGIGGQQIPLAARIFAVADATDVLLTGRVYQAPQPSDAVVEEILRCSGSHFDPKVVEAFATVSLSIEEKSA